MRESRKDDTHLWELIQLWDERRRALGIPEPRTDLAAIDLEVLRRLSDFREISRARGTLVGADAVEIEISYTLLLPLNNLDAKDTPIMERKIVFKKGAQFYELTYTAVAEDYYAYLESFRDAVNTFKFRRGREEVKVFQPLVTLTPTYAVREKPEEYEAES